MRLGDEEVRGRSSGHPPGLGYEGGTEMPSVSKQETRVSWEPGHRTPVLIGTATRAGSCHTDEGVSGGCAMRLISLLLRVVIGQAQTHP